MTTVQPKNLDDIAAAARKPAGGRTPVDMGHYGIRIESDGTWLHGGTPFTRLALAKLFATVLKRDADGDYWLETPVERGRIDVEDAPFLGVELAVEGEGPGQTLKIRTNLDEWVTLDAEHPLRIATDAETGAPRPYVDVRAGLEARLTRPVYYELAELAVEDADGAAAGVWSGGLFHVIGPLEDDVA